MSWFSLFTPLLPPVAPICISEEGFGWWPERVGLGRGPHGDTPGSLGVGEGTRGAQPSFEMLNTSVGSDSRGAVPGISG